MKCVCLGGGDVVSKGTVNWLRNNLERKDVRQGGSYCNFFLLGHSSQNKNSRMTKQCTGPKSSVFHQYRKKKKIIKIKVTGNWVVMRTGVI